MKNKDIEVQYDSFHETYSDNLSEQNELSNTLFHKAVDLDLKGKKILDIGCGDGTDLALLGARGGQVFGVDPSAEFLKTAQDNNPSGIFKKGLGESIPCDDAMFDIVVSKWAIQTSTNVPEILKEMARVTKKGGTVVFLSKHPWIQWLEKVRDYGHGADYYQQMLVTSNIYNGKIVLKEPSHTISEYFNSEFFKNFEMIDYQEGTDFPASEQINGDIYPTFFIVKAKRK
jgi:ubiquinone/menaquinone biosynthesis C-methylase UbiE